MNQDPSGGTQAEVGSGVTITVGTGPSSVQVPGLYANTPAQAESVLQGAGLRLGAQSREYNSDVAEGRIFFQNPSGGENVEPGSAVDVIVSLGPEQVEVPEVYGLSVAAAQTALSNAGLNSTAIEVEGDEAAGTALSTDPGVGAMLDPGSTVSLYYSAGPPPVTTPSPDASGSPEDASSNSEPDPGSDQGGQGGENTEAQPADERPADRPESDTTPQDNGGPDTSGSDNSGQGSSGPPDNSGQGNGTQNNSGSGNGAGLGTTIESQGSGSQE
jgi:beta-lactam-binding protein with PASTA domain